MLFSWETGVPTPAVASAVASAGTRRVRRPRDLHLEPGDPDGDARRVDLRAFHPGDAGRHRGSAGREWTKEVCLVFSGCFLFFFQESDGVGWCWVCLLYTSPSPRDA